MANPDGPKPEFQCSGSFEKISREVKRGNDFHKLEVEVNLSCLRCRCQKASSGKYIYDLTQNDRPDEDEFFKRIQWEMCRGNIPVDAKMPPSEPESVLDLFQPFGRTSSLRTGYKGDQPTLSNSRGKSLWDLGFNPIEPPLNR